MISVPRFALVLLAFAAAVLAVAVPVVQATPGLPADAPTWAVAAVLLCTTLTLGAFALTSRALHSRAAAFTQALLAGTMAKLLLSALAVGLTAYLRPDVVVAFVAVYFSAYFACSGWEVYALLRNLRRGNGA